MNEDSSNVVVVVLDTLRPDFLSPYGGEMDTPTFERIAMRGMTFERAYAAGPGSSISHAALFTGQYPSESGVVGQVDLPEDVPVIAEWLREHGYDTFGIPGPSRIGSHWGYDRGFNEYLEKWHDIPSGVSIGDFQKALENPALLHPMPKHLYRWLTKGPGKHTNYLIDVFSNVIRKDLRQPFFAFANFPTVHGPFDPPRPYKEDATPALDRPRWEFLEWLGLGTETLEMEGVRSERIYEIEHGHGLAKYYADSRWLNEREIDVLRRWYAALVKFLDDALAKFLEFFERKLADDTYLFVLADHGEHFGEHDLLRHMYSHFDECLHVPMFLLGPGVSSGERRSDFVSLIDVFDTICEFVGIEAPSTTSGRSLFTTEQRASVFAENGHRELSANLKRELPKERQKELSRGYKSVRDREHLYILDSEGGEHLYSRPGEAVIDDPNPDVLSDYQNRIIETLGPEFGVGYQDEDYDSSVEENLRHLGYIE